MTLHAYDWTGSASKRKPQGICRPPEPVELICEWVPAGTPVMVKQKREPSKKWRSHITRLDLPILETLKNKEDSILFANGEWMVLVSTNYIRRQANQHPKHIQTTERSGLSSACVGQGTEPGDGP